MIAVVQRVTRASVTVDSATVGQIGQGIVALVSVERDDSQREIDWMADKLAHLRIFRSEDSEKYFDRDVLQIGGSILMVSNFTVAAETSKGRRPSLSAAADPDTGRKLFDQLVTATRALNVPVETGTFQAEMLVSIDNDGPVTFIVSTRDR